MRERPFPRHPRGAESRCPVHRHRTALGTGPETGAQSADTPSGQPPHPSAGGALHHRLRTVYVFFPDPWPKRHHHIHRLFSPLFLDALWDKLEVGGTIQIATDHPAYFEEIQARFAADARFAPYPAMERDAEEQTDFEMLFRSQGLPIGQCAYQTLPGFDRPLPPMTIPPEMEPDPAKHPEVEWEAEGEGEG